MYVATCDCVDVLTTMSNPIRFRRNTVIGAADAESDGLYLEHCFVDNGDIDILLDCKNPKCLILGRTGSGKTALLKRILSSADHVAELSPEALSLHYITNSNIIRFFEEAGVELDVFYALLWRHIITVELLKLRFEINNQKRQIEFLELIKGIFAPDKAKERALAYLSEWGDKFWEETEYRTKEFTSKLERELSASVDVGVASLSMGAQGARTLSEEKKVEIRERGSRVVHSVQVKELHDVITFLSTDIFTDHKEKYYLVIDRLDEGWVEDRIRFKLIKALIETLKTFKRIATVKIIVAIRSDLHFRVIKENLSPGFQEEKYQSLYLRIKWTKEQLVRLLNNRVSFTFRHQYTQQDVGILDIFPDRKLEKEPAVEYILERTFFRPREAIIFLNECIAEAEDTAAITMTMIRQAEIRYSQERLNSLAQEWGREFPRLRQYISILEQRRSPFAIKDLDGSEIQLLAEKILTNQASDGDPIFKACEEYYTGSGNPLDLVRPLFAALYQVGAVGFKTKPHLGRQWSFSDQPVIADSQIHPDIQVFVHKTFWAALGITGNDDFRLQPT